MRFVQMVGLVLGLWACETPLETLRPYAEPSTDWAFPVHGTTQGGPLDGHLVVFVLGNGELTPVSSALVLLQSAQGERMEAITDEEGRVDFAGPDLIGPVDLHIFHREHTIESWVGVDATTITAPLLFQSEGPSTQPLQLDYSGEIEGLELLEAPTEDRTRFVQIQPLHSPIYFVSVPQQFSTREKSFRTSLPFSLQGWDWQRGRLLALGGSLSSDEAPRWESITHMGFVLDAPLQDSRIRLTHPLNTPIQVDFPSLEEVYESTGAQSWLLSTWQSLNDGGPGLQGPNQEVFGLQTRATVRTPPLTGVLQGASRGVSVSVGGYPKSVRLVPTQRATDQYEITRLVVPREVCERSGRTISLDRPQHEIEFTRVELRSEGYWGLNLFEHRDSITLPRPPPEVEDPLSKNPILEVRDYAMNTFTPSDWTGSTNPEILGVATCIQ